MKPQYRLFGIALPLFSFFPPVRRSAFHHHKEPFRPALHSAPTTEPATVLPVSSSASDIPSAFPDRSDPPSKPDFLYATWVYNPTNFVWPDVRIIFLPNGSAECMYYLHTVQDKDEYYSAFDYTYKDGFITFKQGDDEYLAEVRPVDDNAVNIIFTGRTPWDEELAVDNANSYYAKKKASQWWDVFVADQVYTMSKTDLLSQWHGNFAGVGNAGIDDIIHCAITFYEDLTFYYYVHLGETLIRLGEGSYSIDGSIITITLQYNDMLSGDVYGGDIERGNSHTITSIVSYVERQRILSITLLSGALLFPGQEFGITYNLERAGL